MITLISLSFIACSCCGYFMSCDCEDDCHDTMVFVFNTSGDSSSFLNSRLEEFQLIKLKKGTMNGLDTIQSISSTPGAIHDRILIGADTTMATFCTTFKAGIVLSNELVTDGDYTDFDYLILVDSLSQFHLTDLQESGEFGGGRCCSCYTQNHSSVRINGNVHSFIDEGPAVLNTE